MAGSARAAGSRPGRRAVFLDRDGILVDLVVNLATGSHEGPLRPEQVRLRAGAAELLRGLRAEGWALVVVSNQPGMAKGECPAADLDAVHEHVVEGLAAAGAEVDAWYYCHHHPQGARRDLAGTCACRKPEPGLLLQAATDLGLDLSRSWILGDRDSDMEAGRRAGCRTFLVPHPRSGGGRSAGPSDLRAEDLSTVVAQIRKASVIDAGLLQAPG